MAGKDNAWLLVGLLSLAVWAFAGNFASAQASDWETYMEAATKAYREGRYAEAEKQLKAALKEAEDFRPEDPRVATSLNNLGGLYHAQGKYAEAEPLLKRSLAMREKILGPVHPEVARSLNNLAGLYHAQGNYIAAEPLYKRALAIQEKALGPEHPNVATSLNNLAELYRAQGNRAAAETALQAFAGDPGEASGTGASQCGHESEQPGGALPRPGQLRRSRTAPTSAR